MRTVRRLTRWAHPRTRRRVARAARRAGDAVEGTSYLRRWVALGVLVGLVAGVGALAFFESLQAGTHLLLGTLGGYEPAGTVGEGGAEAASGFARPWAVPLVVAGGALVSALLVRRLAPEAEGHGTDAAIHAIHEDPTGMRTRVAVVKTLASAVTIGSGGSGGREGPVAQVSATFGSALARMMRLPHADARILVTTGLAAGIGAVFGAPLGGAVLGAELLYLADVEVMALVSSLVASTVAYAVFGAVEGFTPVFGRIPEYALQNPAQLGWFALVGLAAGLVGRLYARVFNGATDRFARSRVPAVLRPALAGGVVGLLGLAVPGVLGTGYGVVQGDLSTAVLLSTPLWLVLLLPFAKIAATALSIGSGGSGGVFGPGMVIGAAAGAALWRLLQDMPGVPESPAPFVIVGMAACFGSVAHAPLAVMLMVAEMTGNLSLLPPAMAGVAVATVVVGRVTIYRSQRHDRSAPGPGIRPAALPVPAGSGAAPVVRRTDG